MATVFCNCPDCGIIEKSSDDIVVRRISGQDGGTCQTSCGLCNRRLYIELDAKLVSTLFFSGIKVETTEIPQELDECRELTNDGRSPMDYIDERNFRAQLEGIDTLADMGLEEFGDVRDEVSRFGDIKNV